MNCRSAAATSGSTARSQSRAAAVLRICVTVSRNESAGTPVPVMISSREGPSWAAPAATASLPRSVMYKLAARSARRSTPVLSLEASLRRLSSANTRHFSHSARAASRVASGTLGTACNGAAPLASPALAPSPISLPKPEHAHHEQ